MSMCNVMGSEVQPEMCECALIDSDYMEHAHPLIPRSLPQVADYPAFLGTPNVIILPEQPDILLLFFLCC